jgi:hypothetical protein
MTHDETPVATVEENTTLVASPITPSSDNMTSTSGVERIFDIDPTLHSNESSSLQDSTCRGFDTNCPPGEDVHVGTQNDLAEEEANAREAHAELLEELNGEGGRLYLERIEYLEELEEVLRAAENEARLAEEEANSREAHIELMNELEGEGGRLYLERNEYLEEVEEESKRYEYEEEQEPDHGDW